MKNKNANKDRSKNITKVSLIGIISNIFLVVFKMIAGLIASSITIVLDAVNNLTDAVSSLITLLGIKLSKLRPTKKHPFGFGRIEYFSSFIIGILIFTTGIIFIQESISKIITPELPDYGTLQIVIISVAIVIKLILGFYTRKKGKQYKSDALIGSGMDAIIDAFISLSTLVSIFVALYFHYSIEGIVGILISVFILRTAITIMLSAGSKLIGVPVDYKVQRKIKKDINTIDGVLGVYDLIIHPYGPDSSIGSVHLEINNKMSLDEFNELTLKIQNMIYEKYHIFLTVGLYPINKESESIRKYLLKTLAKEKNVHEIHGVYINKNEKFISVDIVIDFLPKDKETSLKDRINKILLRKYKGYKINTVFDLNYGE